MFQRKHIELHNRYDSYPGEKIGRYKFMQRVLQYGYTKEDAIQNKSFIERKCPIKTKIDDDGRVCPTCNVYKTWDKFHKFRKGVNGRTSNCAECRRQRDKQYKKTNQEKVRESKLKARTLTIGQRITFMDSSCIDETWIVRQKEHRKSYRIQSELTGLWRNLDTCYGKNYKKFYLL